MKKIVALLALACLLFTGCISYFQVLRIKEESNAASQQVLSSVSETSALQLDFVDLAALYAAHSPDTVVGTVGDREITWSEFFYFYGSYILDVESAMQYYAQYGYAISWDDVFDETSGTAWRELPAESAVQDIREYTAISSFSAEKGITLSDEAEAAVEASLLDAARDALGETATLADFESFLAQYYLPVDVYRQMLRTNSLYNQILTEQYHVTEESDTETLEQARTAFSADLLPVYDNTVFTWAEGFTLPSIP